MPWLHKTKLALAGCLAALFFAAIAALSTQQPALAVPEGFPPQWEANYQLQSLQTEAEAIKQEMTDLNRNLEVVVERYNATQDAFDQLTRELADSRLKLDYTIAQYEAQEQQISDRLTAIYKGNSIDVIGILLSSHSFSEFFENSWYLAKINELDVKLDKQIRANADEIEVLTRDIDQKRREERRLQLDMAEQKSAIEKKIAERQSKLNKVSAQVKQILDQEAERERAEQARKAAEAAERLRSLQISDAVRAQVVQTALQYLGVPYVWGGESPAGFDCSGLTKYVFARHGVSLPHFAASQYRMGSAVPDDQLQPGDLIFWGPVDPHHVAMYIGQGKYVEAPTFGEVVKISELDFGGDYAGARRFALQPRAASASSPAAPRS